MATTLVAETAEERRVCVTGDNGFISSWLARALLDKGYTPSPPQSITAPKPPTSAPSPAAAAAAAAATPRASSSAWRAPARSWTRRTRSGTSSCPRCRGPSMSWSRHGPPESRRWVVVSPISATVPNPRWRRPVHEECRTNLDYYKAYRDDGRESRLRYAEQQKLDMVTINPSTCLLPSCSLVSVPALQPSNNSCKLLLLEMPDASRKYLCEIYRFKDFAETFLSCPLGTTYMSEDSLRRYVSYASESCIQELLSASDSSRAGGGDGWKVLAFENGVEISKRCSGSLHVFRSRWLLRSVSPQQFITVANAIDAAKEWDPDLVEAKYIKDLNDNLSIICLRFGDASKPLFKNREFIVYERRETMDDGTLVVAVASLPKEIAAGLQPKKNNAIRGLLLQSGWVVEKLEDDSCMVTYVVQLDPAGWLPKCFVNRLNTKLVMIIENLKMLAQTCPMGGAI